MGNELKMTTYRQALRYNYNTEINLSEEAAADLHRKLGEAIQRRLENAMLIGTRPNRHTLAMLGIDTREFDIPPFKVQVERK
jgi:hypothetical protein